MINNTNNGTKPNYDSLVAFLRERFDDLRWVASFNARTYRHEMHYIRSDLRTELTNHEYGVVIEIRPDNDITIPSLVEECFGALYETDAT